MPQPTVTAGGRLEAQYTVKRLGIRRMQALVLDVSRREVVIEVDKRDGGDPIQPGDILELEILLPEIYLIPQRYLYCRCHVDEVTTCADGNRLELTVDVMQFRGEVTPLLSKSEIKTRRVM